MHISIGPRGVLQIDGARITHKNFSGKQTMYNREGDRNFSLIIDTIEEAELLRSLGWNVKSKPSAIEGEPPFMTMKVKVKFSGFGPDIYLKSGNAVNLLDEQTVGVLDKIAIANIDLDIRPYDTEVNGKPIRSAYLNGADVTQSVDRFAERHAARFGSEEE